MAGLSDRYSSTKGSRHQSSHASNLFEPATSTTDTGVSEIGRLPFHVHEMLSHASAQLISHNQKALEDKTTRVGSLKAITSQGSCNTLDIRCGKLDSRDDHVTVPRITAAGSGYTYAHAPKTRFGDQQSDPHRKKQIQINYLDSLASRIPTPGSLHNELQAKENLRVILTKVAQEALEKYALKHGYTVGPKAIDLKCFGSLRNGFILPNTDLDLMVRMHQSSFPKELEKECSQILESAFLDAGFGAYLLPDTMTPIIKLCEKPSQEFLDIMVGERERRQIPKTHQPYNHQPGYHTGSYYSNQNAWCLSDTLRSRHKTDYFGFSQAGLGIRCDINFSGSMPLYNTELLRCYALCDERVRLIGVFVKMWVRARKINDPYRGTMCSYGYILMAIHYLMNVANPPLVPNLQAVPRSFPGHVEATNINGYDVRFLNDESELRAISKRNRLSGNQQSVGELLRGFFAYYGTRGSGSPQGSFHWANNAISIRTQDGIIPKDEKGWHTAKTDRNGNRLRFLLAIEDPFEHEHNIAATVTEGGVSTIRAEFNRAQTIINRIQEIPGVGWEWRTDEGDVGQDLLAEAQDLSNSCRQPRNPGSPTGPGHLDCVPELCTARMDNNPRGRPISKSSSLNGHPSAIPGPQSSCAGSASDNPAKCAHHDTFHLRSYDHCGNTTIGGPIRVTGKHDASGPTMPPASPLHANSSLMRLLVSSITDDEQTVQEFRQPAGLATEVTPDPKYRQGAQDINFWGARLQSPDRFLASPSQAKIMGSSSSGFVIDGHKPIVQISEGAPKVQQLTVPHTSRFRGVSLDLRQFHGPGVIRDRRAASKHGPTDFLNPSPNDNVAVASDTESACQVDDLGKSELLANLPFGG
ncbi:uncharacterized protein ACHE_40270A [Aspergillus chevalieri]|uniref:PAP-associated domain-containing protein n=1 Tax=Aspergillus chevalieri TaxID=182096 RepID=A0A7R7VN20_ASPCH|nr:uncharacterized protein ACHE_40270A [Aspergillus chevalieri]BCR87706.1 hypothetical protein ACHE_40270A [Aspergillus chevalieri]